MRTLLALLFVTAFLSGASAQTQQAPKTREELMLQTLQVALSNIQSARCGADRCKPASDEEKKNPPISLTETSQVFGRGVFSGGAAFCGLDWSKRNYEPMMAYWRNERKKNERQLALISIIHGLVMQQIQQTFAGKGDCPAEIKKDLESKLDFKP